MFIDTAKVNVHAGNGGNGIVSFRHEKYVEKGGPDGGDGGKGGDVILVAQENVNTLAQFRHNPLIRAENGYKGGKRNQRGRSGEDLEVIVPVGTTVLRDDEIIADLSESGAHIVIAKGGEGGYGNAHFKSSRRQAPRVAELGEPGEEFELTFELKLVADVGLVGLPNAGKSTFLSVISNAKPKIANYPFTTLVPNLGVVEMDDFNLVIADIPGLIEGASEGRGLGDEFLRHVERTSVLLHLVDASSDTVEADYEIITAEIAKHATLKDKQRIIALTKIDTIETDIVELVKSTIEKRAGQTVFSISSIAHRNIKSLLHELQIIVDAHKQQIREKQEAIKEESDGVPVYELEPKQEDWRIEVKDGEYYVFGNKIERFAVRTDTSNYYAQVRLLDILRRQGILPELEKKGYDFDKRLTIGKKTFNFRDI